MNKLDIFNKSQQVNAGKFKFNVGDTVKVHQRIKEGDKERIQVFEGLVIAKKHGTQPNATFTVRKVSYGIGVERVFPLHSPLIANVEAIRSAKVRRSKIYFIRTAKGKRAKLKAKGLEIAIVPEAITPASEEETIETVEETKETTEAKAE